MIHDKLFTSIERSSISRSFSKNTLTQFYKKYTTVRKLCVQLLFLWANDMTQVRTNIFIFHEKVRNRHNKAYTVVNDINLNYERYSRVALSHLF